MYSGIRQEFIELEQEKSDLTSRCELYSGWTIPSLFLPENLGHQSELQNGFQSIGAQAVNHLANKLVFALFTPTRPFFRLDASAEYRMQLEEEGVDEAALTLAFSAAERRAMRRLLKRRVRTSAVQAMKLLIVTGNCLPYFPPDGAPMQVYSLRDYVVKRDLSGRPITIITKDCKKVQTLTEEIQEEVKRSDKNLKADSNVTLYTRVHRDHTGKWRMQQSVEDIALSSEGEWRDHMLPWVPLTWALPRGWAYGVGLVEEYSGDFHAINMLTESLVRGAAVAADLKFLVDPAGVTDVQALNESETGDYVPGRPNDIHAWTVDKGSDWQIVQAIISEYARRIGHAFLLNSAVTRDAERVTAEEIRFQAQELETALGGVYSRLADDLQLPLAYQSLRDEDLEVDGKRIEPMIITGMDSLQRNTDADNLLLYLNDLAMIAQVPEQLQEYLKPDQIMQIMAGNRGVEIRQVLKSSQEVQQARQQRMQEQMQLQRGVE